MRLLTSCFRLPVSWPDPRLAAALARLASRVKRRYVLETVRLTLVWGLAATAGLLTILYLAVPEQPVLGASLAGFLVAAVVIAWRYAGRPDARDVVHLADTLGLEGRAVTALRLLQQGLRDGWEEHALAAALEDGAARDRQGWPSYPVVPSRGAWQGPLVLAAVLVVLAWLPNPLAGYWEAARNERAALAAAREQVEAAVERVAPVELAGERVFSPEEQAELAARIAALQEAGNRDEAVRRIEEAEAVLAEKAVEIDPAAGDDWQSLAEAWREKGGNWDQAGEALAAGDADALAEAMEQLAEEMAGAGAAAQEAGREILEAAEAVSDAGLRQALRRAGRSLMGSGPRVAGEAEEALAALGRELAETAAASQAAGQMAGTAAHLDAVARVLAGGGDAAAIAAAAGGTPGNSTGQAGSAAGAAGAGNTSGASGSGSGGAGSGSLATAAAGSSTGPGGSGSGGATGEGSGSGTGDGDGNGSGTGSSSGSGTGGGGEGAGGHGAGTSGGGLEMIYVPSLLGGEGEEVRVPGEMREGEAGTEVTLENSPTTLGAVRPYTEVYPQYLREAQESLSQAPLPPALADLVRDYFTSLEPK